MENIFHNIIDCIFERLTDFVSDEIGEEANIRYPLHEAVVSENILLVFKRLKTIPVDETDADDTTALMEASLRPFTSRNRLIMKLLLRKGADPLKQCNYASPAYNIFRRKDVDLMLAVLDYIEDVNRPVFFDKKLLDTALSSRNSFMVKRLLDMGADYTKSDPKEVTYLHEAVCVADAASVKLFLDAGINVNSTDFDQRTPLHYAVLGSSHDSHECIHKLLCNGAKINAIDRYGNTPLNYAMKESESFDEATLKILLDFNCDTNIADSEGNTPLHNLFFTTGLNSFLKAVMLIKKGTKLNVKNKSGKTPLHLAVENGYNGSCVVLIEHGADMNIGDANRVTPLQRAQLYNLKVLGCFMVEYMTISKCIRNKEISEHNIKVIRSDNTLLQYWKDCEDEILRLRDLVGNLSVVHFYWNSRKAVGCARSKKVRKVLHRFPEHSFPIYGYKITTVSTKVLLRRALEDVAEECLNEIFGHILPPHCVTNIITNFSNDDLMDLADEYLNRCKRQRNLAIYESVYCAMKRLISFAFKMPDFL